MRMRLLPIPASARFTIYNSPDGYVYSVSLPVSRSRASAHSLSTILMYTCRLSPSIWVICTLCSGIRREAVDPLVDIIGGYPGTGRIKRAYHSTVSFGHNYTINSLHPLQHKVQQAHTSCTTLHCFHYRSESYALNNNHSVPKLAADWLEPV
jgi:hypothetical protein